MGKDLTGLKFGKLLVLSRSEKVTKNRQTFWSCLCECGNKKEVRGDSLVGGKTISCGCYNVERAKSGNNRRQHGMVGTHFYNCWSDMKKRCENINYNNYEYYGKKGIKFSDEWNLFENFMNDMYDSYIEHLNKHGEENTTLDRINSDANYCKENCKWATRKEQALNRRNRIIMNAYSPNGVIYEGVDDISEFCKEHDLNRVLVYKCIRGESKIHKGWKFEKILEKDVDRQ